MQIVSPIWENMAAFWAEIRPNIHGVEIFMFAIDATDTIRPSASTYGIVGAAAIRS